MGWLHPNRRSELPRIDRMRLCLVSGGKFAGRVPKDPGDRVGLAKMKGAEMVLVVVVMVVVVVSVLS